VLHWAILLHPNDSADTIATRLATTRGWTDAERQQAVRRVREIQRAVWTQAVFDRALVPATRNAADIDAYLITIDRRAEAALDRLHHDSNA
jgi:putative alpha-1,2-mannosidase